MTADGQVPWFPEGARATAKTDADGRHIVRGVPEGTYRPVVNCPANGCDFLTEWSGDASRIEDATPIEVRETKATTFNAGLTAAAHIVTHVVNADGTPATPGGGSPSTTPRARRSTGSAAACR